ncbi:unnamed protein product [Mytilus edulis]|uniref:Uncharacterized protein n=1 Tax=Mytilus edulis TaxID=6550 RepID=A0A8S3QK92_MYTED|nr:unnamed protein product [Mytilus edulis]
MFQGPSAVKESMMSLRVDAFGNQTFYEKVDETEILYAEFPQVKIKALANYTHTVDEQQVAMMKTDQIYSLIKQVGDWWEITDNPGPSFFVKSKYAVIVTEGHVLSPVRKPSIKHGVSSTAVQKYYTGATDDYDIIPGDHIDEKATFQKTTGGDQSMHNKHAPVRKANSSGLQRRAAVYYSENQDSSDIALKPSQKTKAFRKRGPCLFQV